MNEKATEFRGFFYVGLDENAKANSETGSQ